MSSPSLDGLTVVGFESRMSDTTADLVEKYDGDPLPAPSMQEAPLDEHDEVFAFADELFAGGVDIAFFTTGVGTRMLFETLEHEYEPDTIRNALADVQVVARGPKPGGALRGYDVSIDHKVPEPNTWREALDLLTSRSETSPLDGKRIAIQEYGRPNSDLNEALQEHGAELVRVPIYRWELPDDLQPLKNGLRSLIGREGDIALFTSRQQVVHVMKVADREGWEQVLRKALDDALVASVGPVTSEELRDHDLPVDFEPDRPKLAIFIRELAEHTDQYFEPA